MIDSWKERFWWQRKRDSLRGMASSAVPTYRGVPSCSAVHLVVCFDRFRQLISALPTPIRWAHCTPLRTSWSRRQAESLSMLSALRTLFFTQEESLQLPKRPLAVAIGYWLNQWKELALFVTDGAVPMHNGLAEQQMKRTS